MAKRIAILIICMGVMLLSVFFIMGKQGNTPVDRDAPAVTGDNLPQDDASSSDAFSDELSASEEVNDVTEPPVTTTESTTTTPESSELPSSTAPSTEERSEDTAITENTTSTTQPTAPTTSETAPVSSETSSAAGGPSSSEEKAPTVRIMLGGDTSVDGEFADVCYENGVDYPWKQVDELLRSADLAVLNLETCVSADGVSEKKEGYGFRTPPEMLEGFVNAGVDMVNLANNHTRDFGYQALLNTFDSLEQYGIDYFGAGKDLDEAAGLVIKEINGIKIGFTGSNRVWLPEDYEAGVDHAGINQIHSASKPSTQAYLAKLREYDKQVDVLIAFMHYGTEEVFEVTSYQQSMAREMIDCGVDIFVGGHSHTLQPIEFYNGKPIFYSIGNFIFWHIDDDIDGLSAVFDMEVSRDGLVNLRLHPVFIKRYRANLVAKGSDRYDQILLLMNNLCNPNGIAFDEDGYMIEYIPPVIEETEIVTDVTETYDIPAEE